MNVTDGWTYGQILHDGIGYAYHQMAKWYGSVVHSHFEGVNERIVVFSMDIELWK